MQTNHKRQGAFYRPELDCLRFFAFLSVFISHAFSIDPLYYERLGLSSGTSLWFSKAVGSGGLGVALFFVLSSYLITELLIREYNRSDRLDIKSFYIRRALRIWPLYFFFLIVVYVAIPQASNFALKTSYLIAMLLFVGNWAAVFMGGMGESVAGPLWSISVEEQFYLAWPLIISRVGVKYLKHVCVGLVIVANIVRIIMEKKGAGFVAFWCNTVTWLDAIAAGALVAILLRGAAPRRSVWQRVLLGGGGVTIWILTLRFRNFLIYPDIASYPLIITGCVMMLLATLGSNLKNPMLVYLGRISYGLYVYHVLALTLTSFLLVKYSIWHAFLGLSLTFLMAAISYRWLEEPFLRLKKRFAHVESAPVGAGVILKPSARLSVR